MNLGKTLFAQLMDFLPNDWHGYRGRVMMTGSCRLMAEMLYGADCVCLSASR